jgi:hypothetical protein
MKDCCSQKKKGKEKASDKGKGKSTRDQTNMVEDKVTFIIDGEAYNFDMYKAYSISAINEHLIYYDWLSDNATMPHVRCQREAFTTYTPLVNTSIMGIGGKEATVAG